MKLWAVFQPPPFKHLSVSLFPCGKVVLLLPFHGAIWESSEARLRGAEREREIFVPLSSGLPKTLQCSIAWLAQQIFHYNYLSLPLVSQFACLSLLAFSEEFSKSLMCVSSYAAVPTPHQQRE